MSSWGLYFVLLIKIPIFIPHSDLTKLYMRNSHWNDLTAMLEGKNIGYQPTGFIIDSPWIPGWYGISTVDFYASDELWMKSNLKVVNTFPEAWFLPSFWSEYGMCTEPSALVQE
jgi:hypothetical protein